MEHQSNRNQQIGNICVQWSNLEYHLAALIWIMARLSDDVGKILTAGMDAKQRATAAFALAHQINAPKYLKTALRNVLTGLREHLIEERNRAVHGVHFHANRPDAVMVETHRGKGARVPRLQIDSDLHVIGKNIGAITRELDENILRYAKEIMGEHAKTSQALRDMESILRNTASAAADGDTSSQSQ